jgi:hypothetical protein
MMLKMKLQKIKKRLIDLYITLRAIISYMVILTTLFGNPEYTGHINEG